MRAKNIYAHGYGGAGGFRGSGPQKLKSEGQVCQKLNKKSRMANLTPKICFPRPQRPILALMRDFSKSSKGSDLLKDQRLPPPVPQTHTPCAYMARTNQNFPKEIAETLKQSGALQANLIQSF